MPRPARDVVLQIIRKEFQDLKLAIQREPPPLSTVEQSVKTQRRPPERVLKYSGTLSTVSRDLFDETTEVKCIYDLAECIRLQDIESYFAVSVDRHVELIMKRGYHIKGRNPETVAYVRRRLREVSLVSDQPFTDVIRQLVRNVVECSNAYLVFYRDETRSTGVRTRMWGKERDPIAAVSVPDPSSVTIRQTKTGRPSAYTQNLPGHSRSRTWQHHDVVHIPWRRKSSHPYGTPFVISVLEDIRALRKLEMVAEHVSHKHAFPMMHWKVGTEKIPAGKVTDHSTGTQVAEVLIAAQYAESLAQEGFVVTSERHNVVIIGADGAALDLSPYIDHYEGRVLAGLRLSRMDIGEGDTANRGTATSLSKILVDACTDIQSVVSEFLTERFLDHLVMEGGYNLTEENQVLFIFPAIDTEEERASQNHGLQLYVQGGITREEFRREYMSLDDLNPEEEANLYLNEHLIPLAKAQAEIKAINAAKKAAASGKTAASVGNRAQPENQHRKLPTAPRLPANDLTTDEEIEERVHTVWDRLSIALIEYLEPKDREDPRDCRPAFTQAWSAIASILEENLDGEWKAGFDKAYEEAKTVPPVLMSEVLTKDELHQVHHLLVEFKTKDLHAIQSTAMLQSNIEGRTGLPKSSSAAGSVMAAFQSTRVILDAKIYRVRRAAWIVGYLQGQKAVGKDSVTLDGEALTLTDMKARPDIVRALARTTRLQNAMLSISTASEIQAPEPADGDVTST